MPIAPENVPEAASPIVLSIVIPVNNEADNLDPLIREIRAALSLSTPYEIVFVDDGSTDATRERIAALRAQHSTTIRLLLHTFRCGQSAALCTGVRAARAEWIVTLDGDGQNDPADIPALVRAAMEADHTERLRLIMGNRVSRRDTRIRRVSSRIANGVRRSLLKDETPDTGCGIKVFHRRTFLSLPTFAHMHRFLPALFLREGMKVISLPVNHRPRIRGKSKYGINNRLWVGIIDLFGVRWLMRRAPAVCNVTEE